MGGAVVMRLRRPEAVAAGLLLDWLLGDPPTHWHPVGWFGTVMTRLERMSYRDARAPGVAYVASGVTMALTAAAICRSTTLATSICAAGRGLVDAAHHVDAELTAGNLDQARSLVPALVGRDPAEMSETDVARAVVESVAENTVDAVVAPTFWALVGGAHGALVHRAINTMDSMVGHRSTRYRNFGWCAARLDDAAAWIPARLTAALVVAVRPAAAPAIQRAVREQAPLHPSPNAGVAEAAYAAALGVTLGGMNRYDGHLDSRPPLGSGPPPQRSDIRRATRLCRDVTAATIGLLTLLAASERTGR